MDKNVKAIYSHPCLFQTPDYLSNVKPWHGHIPFAFWLIDVMKPSVFVELGTHQGDSYFAFCQMVKEVYLQKFTFIDDADFRMLMVKQAMKCFAVDHFKGDIHSGYFDEDYLYSLVSSENNKYKDFSTILRMSFDEGVSKFENRSIDLLHIDGLHTYDACKHDFETWLPKMSDKGVVLFHDSDITNGGFGVFMLMDELKKQYPYFEFRHSNGLTLIAVGGNVNEEIITLCSLDGMEASKFKTLLEMLGSFILYNESL